MHTDVGYNSYSYFEWHNWGSGYDDFKVKVDRVDNGDRFTKGGQENAVITFSGGDDEATVTPSDGTAYLTRCRCFTTFKSS